VPVRDEGVEMRESSKRPAMAFVTFIRDEGNGVGEP